MYHEGDLAVWRTEYWVYISSEKSKNVTNNDESLNNLLLLGATPASRHLKPFRQQ